MIRTNYVIFFIVSFLVLSATLGAKINLDDSFLLKFEEKYGPEPAQLMREWHELLSTVNENSDREKMIAVNDFFNKRLLFKADILHWNKKDYWATPYEFIGTGAGDCEDFSIAKYSSLLALGVPDDKLRMTYVKALTYNQAHMVVTYYSKPESIPLVLDNLNPALLAADKRHDLLPVYSFNSTGLWIVKARGWANKVQLGKSRRAIKPEIYNL